jgi:hypothetical protein
LTKNGHFGHFFLKLIWSPWQAFSPASGLSEKKLDSMGREIRGPLLTSPLDPRGERGPLE